MKSKNLATCQKKRKARADSVFRHIFRVFENRLPLTGEYWTLGGNCARKDGKLAALSELGQVLKLGISSVDKFYSVDTDRLTIKNNLLVAPFSKQIYGDLLEVMLQEGAERPINPQVVNYDSQSAPPDACWYAVRLMNFLCQYSEVLLFVNMVLKCGNFFRYRENCAYTEEEALLVMNTMSGYEDAVNHGWKLIGSHKYQRISTVMFTLVFYFQKSVDCVPSIL